MGGGSSLPAGWQHPLPSPLGPLLHILTPLIVHSQSPLLCPSQFCIDSYPHSISWKEGAVGVGKGRESQWPHPQHIWIWLYIRDMGSLEALVLDGRGPTWPLCRLLPQQALLSMSCWMPQYPLHPANPWQLCVWS